MDINLCSYFFGGRRSFGQEKKQGGIVKLEKTRLWGKAKSGPILYSHQDGIIKMRFDIIGKSELVSIDAIASTINQYGDFKLILKYKHSLTNTIYPLKIQKHV